MCKLMWKRYYMRKNATDTDLKIKPEPVLVCAVVMAVQNFRKEQHTLYKHPVYCLNLWSHRPLLQHKAENSLYKSLTKCGEVIKNQLTISTQSITALHQLRLCSNSA